MSGHAQMERREPCLDKVVDVHSDAGTLFFYKSGPLGIQGAPKGFTSSVPVPVIGVPNVALLAVKVGMHGCRHWILLILDGLMRLFPVVLPVKAQRPQRW